MRQEFSSLVNIGDGPYGAAKIDIPDWVANG
jgi:hypothetical protein